MTTRKLRHAVAACGRKALQSPFLAPSNVTREGGEVGGVQESEQWGRSKGEEMREGGRVERWNELS